MPADDHLKGVLITLAGVAVITPDSLLVRLVSTDGWTLLFWRGLLSGLAIAAGLLLVYRGRAPGEAARVGRAGLALAMLFSVGSVAFIASITRTSVANTLFIVSTAPLFAALMGRAFLNEPAGPRTWAAIACTLTGVAIIASGSAGGSGGSLAGDLWALGAAVCMAGTLSIARHARARSMVPAMALSGFLTAGLMLPLAMPFTVTAGDVAALAAMGLLVVPVGFVLLALGPRYLPAPEVSLLLLLEAVTGPLLVWWLLGEHPGARSLQGGALVLLTLAALNASRLFGRRTRSALGRA